MNPRWLALGVLALVPLAACSTSADPEPASSVSFAAAASSVAPATKSVGDPPRAVAGTVCGTVDLPKGSAAVVVREGRANCVEALRVGRVYAAAAAQSEGRAVTVETDGWRCTARVTDSVGTCRAGADAVSVG